MFIQRRINIVWAGIRPFFRGVKKMLDYKTEVSRKTSKV